MLAKNYKNSKLVLKLGTKASAAQKLLTRGTQCKVRKLPGGGQVSLASPPKPDLMHALTHNLLGDAMTQDGVGVKQIFNAQTSITMNCGY